MNTNFVALSVELFVGFWALLVLMKVLGKSQINQLTPFDFISALVLGELVGNAIYDKDIGILYVLYAISAWGLLIYTVEIITQKFPITRPFLEGSPKLIINDGKIMYHELKRSKLDIDQLAMLLREKEVFSIREVHYGILEPNGSISVVKKQGYQTTNGQLTYKTLPIVVVADGVLNEQNLEKAGMTKEAFNDSLRKQGISNYKSVLYAEYLSEDGWEIQTY
ncbi:DUF421 domain-containing protein [Halalkalibacterium halodurans]|uniref:DUF421 domain-containing protein n=1 Tax=Halalkalibacterium halodurans TaxID=86665 RepID=UPI002E247DA1|nr:DUF421 domain-containing protein [Halalkalibacterium halodurans]